MNNLDIKDKTGGLEFIWANQHIKITASRIRLQKDGGVKGEVLISTDKDVILHRTQFNFSSSRIMTELTNKMKARFEQADWETIIEELCYHTIERTRQATPAKELWTSEEITKPEYLIYPIMPLKQPTVIFGEPGAGKSELALVFALCMILPWVDNPLGLSVPKRSYVPLLLDYEAEDDDVKWRLKCLQVGMGLPDLHINYLRCYVPLPDGIEQIEEEANRFGAEVLIIDSLTAASGGDPKEASTALAFFNALRRLKRTSLIIAQTSKDKEVKHKTILGSTIYEYYARSVWELRSTQEPGEDEINLALFHQKTNISALQQPMGFKLCFNEDQTTISHQDVKAIGQFLERMSATTQILEKLKEGAFTPKELCEALELARNTTDQALKRLRAKNKVIKFGDKVGLPHGFI